MEENNLSPEEKKKLLDTRKKRFGNMNIPTPVAPVNPGTVVNVKDPKMLSRLQEIKNGKLKQEFRAFDNKGSNAIIPHQDVPVSTNKKQPGKQNLNSNPNKVSPPPLAEFSAQSDPSLDAVKNLFSDSPSSSAYGQPTQFEDGGSSFSKEFTNKFRNRLQEKTQQIHQNQQQYNEEYNPGYQVPVLQSGMIVLNEEDLKKKIIEVAKPLAKQVATEVIKQVLNEYLKKPSNSSQPVKNTVNESSSKSNVVKTEILSDGKVKINGKIYKISPDK